VPCQWGVSGDFLASHRWIPRFLHPLWRRVYERLCHPARSRLNLSSHLTQSPLFLVFVTVRGAFNILHVRLTSISSTSRIFLTLGENGGPPSPEVHLPHLHHLHRRCPLQLLPSTGPDDAPVPITPRRLLSQLFHKPIPKHFNIIEKNGEFDEL